MSNEILEKIWSGEHELFSLTQKSRLYFELESGSCIQICDSRKSLELKASQFMECLQGGINKDCFEYRTPCSVFWVGCEINHSVEPNNIYKLKQRPKIDYKKLYFELKGRVELIHELKEEAYIVTKHDFVFFDYSAGIEKNIILKKGDKIYIERGGLK